MNTRPFNRNIARTQSDSVVIEELELWTHIGVPDEERVQPQRLLATIQLQTDFSTAARNDDVADALDYARVADAVKRLAASRPRKLVETLAEDIAQMLLGDFAAARVTVELKKFPFKDARSVSVKITRSHYA